MTLEQALKRRDELRLKFPLNGYEAVDLLSTPHTAGMVRAKLLPRYGVRNARQVRLYEFEVVTNPAP